MHEDSLKRKLRVLRTLFLKILPPPCVNGVLFAEIKQLKIVKLKKEAVISSSNF